MSGGACLRTPLDIVGPLGPLELVPGITTISKYATVINTFNVVIIGESSFVWPVVVVFYYYAG